MFCFIFDVALIVASLHIHRTVTKTNKTDGELGFRYSLIQNLNYVTRSHVLALHLFGLLVATQAYSHQLRLVEVSR